MRVVGNERARVGARARGCPLSVSIPLPHSPRTPAVAVAGAGAEALALAPCPPPPCCCWRRRDFCVVLLLLQVPSLLLLVVLPHPPIPAAAASRPRLCGRGKEESAQATVPFELVFASAMLSHTPIGTRTRPCPTPLPASHRAARPAPAAGRASRRDRGGCRVAAAAHRASPPVQQARAVSPCGTMSIQARTLTVTGVHASTRSVRARASVVSLTLTPPPKGLLLPRGVAVLLHLPAACAGQRGVGGDLESAPCHQN